MQCFILSSNKQMFALQVKTTPKKLLMFKHMPSSPCLMAFDNKKKTQDLRLTLQQYSFKDVSELTFDMHNFTETPDKEFRIFNNSILYGQLTDHKKDIQNISVDMLEGKTLEAVEQLIYTQGMHIFIPMQFELGPQVDKKFYHFNFRGVLLQPTFNRIDDTKHMEIMLNHLNTCI